MITRFLRIVCFASLPAMSVGITDVAFSQETMNPYATGSERHPNQRMRSRRVRQRRQPPPSYQAPQYQQPQPQYQPYSQTPQYQPAPQPVPQPYQETASPYPPTENKRDTERQAKKKSSSFGILAVLGYEMTFADQTQADGTKKSITASGLDMSGLVRYKLNLKSVSIPLDIGINYMDYGISESSGNSKVENTMNLMSLSFGSGVSMRMDSVAVPILAYVDYKLSDSVTTKSDSASKTVSDVLDSAYRIKFQLGCVYEGSGAFRIGGVGGFHILSYTPKTAGTVQAKTKTYMGVHFGLVAGAEF